MKAFSSGKINKYDYLTWEEILPFDRRGIMEQAKFTYFPLGKALEKQTNAIEDQREKQIRAINSRFEKRLFRYRTKINSTYTSKS